MATWVVFTGLLLRLISVQMAYPVNSDQSLLLAFSILCLGLILVVNKAKKITSQTVPDERDYLLLGKLAPSLVGGLTLLFVLFVGVISVVLASNLDRVMQRYVLLASLVCYFVMLQVVAAMIYEKYKSIYLQQYCSSQIKKIAWWGGYLYLVFLLCFFVIDLPSVIHNHQMPLQKPDYQAGQLLPVQVDLVGSDYVLRLPEGSEGFTSTRSIQRNQGRTFLQRGYHYSTGEGLADSGGPSYISGFSAYIADVAFSEKDAITDIAGYWLAPVTTELLGRKTYRVTYQYGSSHQRCDYEHYILPGNSSGTSTLKLTFRDCHDNRSAAILQSREAILGSLRIRE
jgi:hypothetical protein